MGVSVVLDPNVHTVLDNNSSTAFKIMCIYDGVVINNPPTFTSPIEITISADATYTFDPAVIVAALTDIEGDSIEKVKVIETVDKGLLTYGVPVITEIIDDDVADFSNYNLFRYTPITGQSGANYTKLTLQFKDDGDNPKCWSEDVVIIFHVVGANMEPTVDDHEIEVDWGSTTVLVSAYFTQNYYDPELDPLGHITINTIPVQSIGKLQLAAVDVTYDQLPLTVTAAQLAAGDLVYIDNNYYSGVGLTDERPPEGKTVPITFTVYDNVP